jgi:uncharacterized MAPEG superfamily protein
MLPLPLFAAAVLVGSVIDRHRWMTIWGARLYFWGAFSIRAAICHGLPLVRSMAWNVATIGIIFVLVGLV